ncbi:hypothetical protein CK203_110990 [Vitis vinifera]|uniref:Uncharacterized protein n=1 Tax=Vitis vinifera TaxID=29760 RepID=A0A438CE85_VITVI|nr:hypothetical protein CK203_110990 [Vitis vinifera]
MKTPMSSSIKLDKDEKGKSIDYTMYRGMIGESSLPLGHRASAQLSRLNRRHVKRFEGLFTRMGWLPVVTILKPVFLTLVVFKDADIGLSRETNFEAPNTYDTCDDQPMMRMKFEKATDGSWPSSGPAFTEPLHIEIPPPRAPLALDRAPWIDLSTQISSLGTRMEEFTVVSDTRFYSIEDRMDQYQVLIWKFIKEPNGCKIKTFGRPLIIGNLCKNGESIKALSKPAQLARVPVDWFPLPDQGPVEMCKKHSLSSSSLSFPIEGSAFPIEVRSRIMITYRALNAPMVSESIDPQIDRLRLFFGFLSSRG